MLNTSDLPISFRSTVCVGNAQSAVYYDLKSPFGKITIYQDHLVLNRGLPGIKEVIIQKSDIDSIILTWNIAFNPFLCIQINHHNSNVGSFVLVYPHWRHAKQLQKVLSAAGYPGGEPGFI